MIHTWKSDVPNVELSRALTTSMCTRGGFMADGSAASRASTSGTAVYRAFSTQCLHAPQRAPSSGCTSIPLLMAAGPGREALIGLGMGASGFRAAGTSLRAWGGRSCSGFPSPRWFVIPVTIRLAVGRVTGLPAMQRPIAMTLAGRTVGIQRSLSRCVEIAP